MESEDRKNEAGIRCGVVLAAGDGTRLQSFIHQQRGYLLPKQYVNLIGTRSMLEHTLDRAERLIPSDRLFTVVDLNHLKYREAAKQLLSRPKGTVILQPENKGTGPGILLPLMHLYRRYPESTVVVFPSDHFILEEDVFMGHVELACRAVERDFFRLVLLGMEPPEPEPDYGYILPHQKNHLSPSVIRTVSRFVEKPQHHVAEVLTQKGALWNTLVMAFKAKTLFESIRTVSPSLYRSFQRILGAVGTSQEMELIRDIYGEMEPMNFSAEILEPLSSYDPSHLGVLPVRGVFWSDWGSERRIVRTLQENSRLGPLCTARRALTGNNSMSPLEVHS